MQGGAMSMIRQSPCCVPYSSLTTQLSGSRPPPRSLPARRGTRVHVLGVPSSTSWQVRTSSRPLACVHVCDPDP